MLQLYTTIEDHQPQYKLQLSIDQNESTILALLDECYCNRDMKNLLLEQINLIILHKQSYLTFAKLIEINKNQLIQIHKDIHPKDEINFINEELQIQRQVYSDKIIISLNQQQLELQKQYRLIYVQTAVVDINKYSNPYVGIHIVEIVTQSQINIANKSAPSHFVLASQRQGKKINKCSKIKSSKQERPLIIKNTIQQTANEAIKKVKCHVCGIENEVTSQAQNCYLCQESLCNQNNNECACFPFEKIEPQFQVKNANNKYKISDSQCQTCGNASNNIIKVYQGQCDHYFCMYCIASNKDCKICYPNSIIKTEERYLVILEPTKTVIEEQFYSEA
ncbi:hypothetical protein pb186bvf_007312 [Paramecium bursaria]